MKKNPVHTDRAPAAIGPYSQAIITDSLLFTSGVIPVDPATGVIAPADIEEHAHRVFQNLKAIVEAAGTDLSQAVKVTLFLTDMADFQRVNSVYVQYFKPPFPARTAVAVAALPLAAPIEAEAIVAL
jgi:2-iminobutanoate/2-iminopropanoate deaminase